MQIIGQIAGVMAVAILSFMALSTAASMAYARDGVTGKLSGLAIMAILLPITFVGASFLGASFSGAQNIIWEAGSGSADFMKGSFGESEGAATYRLYALAPLWALAPVIFGLMGGAFLRWHEYKNRHLDGAPFNPAMYDKKIHG